MRFVSTFFSLILTPLLAVVPLEAEMRAAVLLSANEEVSVPPPTTTPTTQGGALQIRLADPGKAVVEATSSVKGFAILVTDAFGLPVADVAVAMRLPEDGATGFFMDGAHSAVAYTDSTGVARFAQVNWGAAVGIVSIRVTAVKGELHAGALIEQTLVAHANSTPQVQVPTLKITSPAAATPAASAKPIPGTPASVASVHSGAATATPAQTAASAEPAVSIVNSSANKGSHGVNKKWVILAAVAVGAGVGAAMALSGHGGSAAAAPVGVTIGTPTISVGHP